MCVLCYGRPSIPHYVTLSQCLSFFNCRKGLKHISHGVAEWYMRITLKQPVPCAQNVIIPVQHWPLDCGWGLSCLVLAHLECAGLMLWGLESRQHPTSEAAPQVRLVPLFCQPLGASSGPGRRCNKVAAINSPPSQPFCPAQPRAYYSASIPHLESADTKRNVITFAVQ